MSTTWSGIDVSEWQGNIDWNKVKASGVQFALLRIGFGDILSYPNQIDRQFKANYQKCKAAGIPVGGYFYCYAEDEAAARREAQGCLSLINGLQFEYPLYYDVEEYDTFRTGKTNEIMKAFADVTESKDWWTGMYIYRSAAQSYLTERTKTRYAMAIAEYGPSLNYSGPYGIWQNSSTTHVNGISGNVDHDFCYVDYPSQIKAKGKNGYPKPVAKLMYQVTKDTPIVEFEGTATAGKTYEVKGRKTVCGVQYGRVTANGYISLKDAKQV